MRLLKKTVTELWNISREKYPNEYILSQSDYSFLKREDIPTPIPVLSYNSKDISAFQSHSERAAWLFRPWNSKDVWYPGLEYKGIGDNGNKIRAVGNIAWGGVILEEAIQEHNFSKKAVNAGIFCQKPIACYEYGKFKEQKLAVLVRTFVSPLRLSDFHFDEKFLKKYLDFREQTEEEYVKYLAETLGKNIRKLFDIGLFHGSLEMNNITTEGELADFEPTSGGTWEGVMENTEPRFRVLALKRLFSAIKDIFPEETVFKNSFANSFFKKKVNLTNEFPEKEIIEKYIGKDLSEKDLEIDFPDFKDLEEVKQILEDARVNSKSKIEKKRLDYILKELG